MLPMFIVYYKSKNEVITQYECQKASEAMAALSLINETYVSQKDKTPITHMVVTYMDRWLITVEL